MSEPTTEAGKWLVGWAANEGIATAWGDAVNIPGFARRILDIEAEARAAALADVKRRVEAAHARYEANMEADTTSGDLMAAARWAVRTATCEYVLAKIEEAAK